jgi:threonyl-tRNA synthetase
MQLNDAHIFCAVDQVHGEASAALAMIGSAYADLGISVARYRLSLGGASGKYVADPELWARASAALRAVLDASGVAYEAEEGEAAFYGPKIDVQVLDHAGREFTLSTVQVDFYQPSRFGLSYVAASGERERPVMVHRSIVGSIERAVAHLIEQHGGAFPAWLAPVQVQVLPVSAKEVVAAEELASLCDGAGLRVRVGSPSDGSLGARIRAARRVPYVAVIGAREAEGREVALRLRDGRQLDPLPAAWVVDGIGGSVRARAVALWDGQ